MTADVRKGVLLRLRPEVLDAVDRARGAQNRTGWLIDVILRELDRLEGRPVPVTHQMAGAEHFSRRESAFSEDEISSEGLADEGEELASEHEYSPASDANGGSGLDGEPPEMGDPAELSSLEGPDDSEFTPGDDL